MHTDITRRTFTFGISAAAAGLTVSVHPLCALATPGNAPIGANEKITPEISVWIKIEQDDTTIIMVARSEMGQGNFTTLPMLVAEELECDWRFVRPQYVEPSENLSHGNAWGDMTTAASISIRGSQSYLRTAGAQARHMLIAEAAERWQVPQDECVARDSVVTHAPTRRTLRYGEIAEAAAHRPIPADVRLKHPDEWRLIGQSIPPCRCQGQGCWESHLCN